MQFVPCFRGRVKRFFRNVPALADKPKELKKQVCEGLPALQAVEPMRVSIEGSGAGIESQRDLHSPAGTSSEPMADHCAKPCAPEFVQGLDHSSRDG